MDINVFIGPIIVIIVVVMIIMMVVKMIKNFTGAKKPKRVDMPRNPMERLITHYKEALNLNRSGHYRLRMSGDRYKKGYTVGWAVYGMIPDNTEHIFFVRRKRWLTVQKPRMVIVEPHLVGDLNTKELMIKGRGIHMIGPIGYVIPTYDTPKEVQDRLWSIRAVHLQTRLMQLLEMDLNTDMVESPKAAIRSSIIQAGREDYEIGDMEKVGEDERRRRIKEKEAEAEAEKKRKAMTDSYRPNQPMGMPQMGR